jgi:putative PIN family toxin of toxin-antitoxin system
MKVVLDANIYVSSLINTQGNPKQIAERWEQNQFDVLVSASIIDEIGRVLRYPRIVKRHRQDEGAIQRFLELLSSQAVMVEPTVMLDAIKEDESDNRYLECAAEGKARYIISGDKHLLELGEYRGIVILSPAAFMTLLERGGL